MIRWLLTWWRGDFSRDWWRHQQRAEFSRGVDQSCVDWDAMRNRPL